MPVAVEGCGRRCVASRHEGSAERRAKDRVVPKVRRQVSMSAATTAATVASVASVATVEQDSEPGPGLGGTAAQQHQRKSQESEAENLPYKV